MPDAKRCLNGCVPVSTPMTQVQNLETARDQDLVHELLNRGWSVGCDAELLPPAYWYEGNA